MAEIFITLLMFGALVISFLWFILPITFIGIEKQLKRIADKLDKS